MTTDTAQSHPAAEATPLTIRPLVLRHAEDAAFYWMQRSANSHSPLLNFDRLSHFDRLLEAHLDGLRVAGSHGWDCALKNLQRWRSGGESFAAYVLAIESGDKMRLQALWEVVKQNPDAMQHGLVSALAWVKEDIALSWMNFWLTLSDHAELQQLALRAFTLRRLLPTVDIGAFFASSHAAVRASACELAGWTQMRQCRIALESSLKDESLEVREAAAIALTLLGHGSNVLSDLWKASLHWNAIAEQSKGWQKSEAARRAEILARYIGHALPIAHPGIPDLLQHIPPRQGLLVLAHHGDPVVIPMIINAMEHKDVARLSGWAFCMITGVDLDRQRLTTHAPQEEVGEDERTTPLRDPDIGLPWPYPDYVKGWWQQHGRSYPGGARLLLGQGASDQAHCVDVLRRGTQAARWAASIHLAAINPNALYFATNASAK